MIFRPPWAFCVLKSFQKPVTLPRAISFADMYFGVCGLLTAQTYGITAESLTWFNFLVKALLPITLGNIVGGAGIVGCGYWLAYLHRTPYSTDTTVAEQEEIDIAEEY